MEMNARQLAHASFDGFQLGIQHEIKALRAKQRKAATLDAKLNIYRTIQQLEAAFNDNRLNQFEIVDSLEYQFQQEIQAA